MNLWNFITLCWLNIKSGHAKNVFYFANWLISDLYKWLNNAAVKGYIKKTVAQSYIQLKGFHLPCDFGAKIGTIKGFSEYGWYTKPAQLVKDILEIEYKELFARNKGNKYWLTLLRLSKGGWVRFLTGVASDIIFTLIGVYMAFSAGQLVGRILRAGIIDMCYEKWVQAEIDKIKAYRRAHGIPLDKPLTYDDFNYASNMTVGDFAGWCIQEYFNNNGQGYMDALVLVDDSSIVNRALGYKMSETKFYSFYRKAGLQCIYSGGSECIKAMWFDFQNNNLYVYFGGKKDPKQTYYRYVGIAWRDMVKFVEQKTDSSIGVWFNRYIRDNYKCKKMNGRMAAVIYDYAKNHRDDDKVMKAIAVPPLVIPAEVEPPEPPPEPDPPPPEPEPEPQPDPPPEPEVEKYYWAVQVNFSCDGYFSDTVDRISATYPFKFTANISSGVSSPEGAVALIQEKLKAAYDYKQYWLDLMSAERVVKWFSVTAVFFTNAGPFDYYSNAEASAKNYVALMKSALNGVDLVGDEVAEGGFVVNVDYTVYKR